jgi:hypothetical protein
MNDDKVLMFIMMNGRPLASEGNFNLVRDLVDKKAVWFCAMHIQFHQPFYIYLPNVESVHLVPRESVFVGPPKVLTPGGGRTN